MQAVGLRYCVYENLFNLKKKVFPLLGFGSLNTVHKNKYSDERFG